MPTAGAVDRVLRVRVDYPGRTSVRWRLDIDVRPQLRERIAPLERHPVLDSLGIPPLRAVTLAPVFGTGFERDEDLAGFYATPQSSQTRHEVQRGDAHAGERLHVAWLTGELGVELVSGPNHRGYPMIQLQHRPGGGCVTPCLVEFWARIYDFDLKEPEWLSLATLSPDPSVRWTRVVTANLGWQGRLQLFHVPDQGVGERDFQRTDLPFPRGSWVRITIWADFDPQHGAAAVWQDGRLVSAARFRGGDGTLDQMHFGLYAYVSVTRGVVHNDDIAVFRADRLP